ncbi:MAG: antitoxin VapB family protein [Euryarchaeota archaeon]|nr:antitoxin VapB family protein [Euryarchaeota archaeon]MDE1835290.1 antitoxin VapB family protein [Euryarchaeota archaeon]MDE1881067.1 antitoxin VapB family protein [Euryarchaeota archaeon]MDE2043586.1 antitoxin VapB family protein [Thermoplasmata archaeon]
MTSKTLMIRRPVYDALREEKRKGESFSKVIERLLSRRHALESLFGIWGVGRRRGPRSGAAKASARRRAAGGRL